MNKFFLITLVFFLLGLTTNVFSQPEERDIKDYPRHEKTHDMGKKGIGNNILSRIISILEDYGNVYITSEREIPSQFEKYKLK